MPAKPGTRCNKAADFVADTVVDCTAAGRAAGRAAADIVVGRTAAGNSDLAVVHTAAGCMVAAGRKDSDWGS